MSEPRLHALFRHLAETGGSDLHLTTGLVPYIRRNGALGPVADREVLGAELLASLLREVTNEHQWHDFETTGDVDFAYGMHGVGRFRVNLLRQERGPAAVFRMIPEHIRPLAELELPPAVERFTHLSSGLVLISGPTGSGKSTTLAAMIDSINKTYAKHIVTIEDPVEFVHLSHRSQITHREVGSDTESFASALRSAIRQDADVILVGEMRDLETISLAVTAAEMGSLVFGTIHTNSAISTVDRLVDAFPAEEQAQIRTTLADSVAGILCQQLLPRADGQGRIAAVEILVRTQGLPNIIREGKTQMIVSVIQGGRAQGMQMLDDHLLELVGKGLVTAEDAQRKASQKELFERKAAE